MKPRSNRTYVLIKHYVCDEHGTKFNLRAGDLVSLEDFNPCWYSCNCTSPRYPGITLSIPPVMLACAPKPGRAQPVFNVGDIVSMKRAADLHRVDPLNSYKLENYTLKFGRYDKFEVVHTPDQIKTINGCKNPPRYALGVGEHLVRRLSDAFSCTPSRCLFLLYPSNATVIGKVGSCELSAAYEQVITTMNKLTGDLIKLGLASGLHRTIISTSLYQLIKRAGTTAAIDVYWGVKSANKKKG